MWRSTSIQRSHYNTLRIVVYRQDSLGLGHLPRTTHIGRHLLDAAPDSAVLLFADSPVAPFFELPDGMDCLIMDNPETPHHPVIAAALHHLHATHMVRLSP